MLTKDLQGSLVNDVRFWENRGPGVAFIQDMIDAQVGKED